MKIRFLQVVIHYLVALLVLSFATLAMPDYLEAQERGVLPRAVEDPTQEVQPQTFPLRIDATEIGGVLRLYLQCGNISAPVGMAQGGFVTTIDFPVVSMCFGGHFVISASDFYVPLPLDGWMKADREGTLGGVLVCVGRMETGYAIFTEPEHVAQSCAELVEPGG